MVTLIQFLETIGILQFYRMKNFLAQNANGPYWEILLDLSIGISSSDVNTLGELQNDFAIPFLTKMAV